MKNSSDDEVVIEDQTPPSVVTRSGSNVPPKPAATKPKQAGHSRKLKWWLKTHRKLSIALLILAIIAFGLGGYLLLRNKPAPTTKPKVVTKKQEEPPKPTTVASPLSGVQVAPELATRPVTGMMIENSPEARPQSGLAEAGVVFEATAEGGITRFLALFQDTKPASLGPVRSIRPYYIDWALPFQAAVGHVGGSPEALEQVKSTKMRDLDQFANGNYYHRTSDRYAPHNMYTETETIDKLMAQKGFTKSEYTPWSRKADKADAKTAVPAVTKISFDISSYLFHVDYNYDKTTNTWLRSMAGLAHKDRATGAQIAPKVVIVLQMDHRLVDAQHYGITTLGSGPAYVFQDGGVTKGTWNKATRTSMFSFKDEAGAEIKLNAGQTWVSIVPSNKPVNFAAQ